MIAKKVAQAEVTPASQRSVAATPVGDIMEALKKCIAVVRKPASLCSRSARSSSFRRDFGGPDIV
jgi:hypothetical protein